MFKCGYFREINQCELKILSTCEFDNHLNDYTDLRYDTSLCCNPESIENKKITEWSLFHFISLIYYVYVVTSIHHHLRDQILHQII